MVACDDNVELIVSSKSLFGRELWLMSGPAVKVEDQLGVHYPMSLGDFNLYTIAILRFTYIAAVAPEVRASLSRYAQYLSIARLFHNVVASFECQPR